MNLHLLCSDDEIYGGPGEDEIYGELGSDTLHGDEGKSSLFIFARLYAYLCFVLLIPFDLQIGNDIVLGDIGYALRRYSGEVPILTSSFKWNKDIILEEYATGNCFSQSFHSIHTLTMRPLMQPSQVWQNNQYYTHL